MKEETDYPFSEMVRFTFEAVPGGRFPFRLRLPRWCARPQATVNGASVDVGASDGFACISRTWRAGDRLTLRLPMTPMLERHVDGNNGNAPSCSLTMGPLVFAHAIPSTDENTPKVGVRTDWKLDPSRVMADVAVQRSPMPATWAWQEDAPVKLVVTATDGTRLPLVPYGCARLRLSMFPEGAQSAAK